MSGAKWRRLAWRPLLPPGGQGRPRGQGRGRGRVGERSEAKQSARRGGVGRPIAPLLGPVCRRLSGTARWAAAAAPRRDAARSRAAPPARRRRRSPVPAGPGSGLPRRGSSARLGRSGGRGSSRPLGACACRRGAGACPLSGQRPLALCGAAGGRAALPARSWPPPVPLPRSPGPLSLPSLAGRCL